MITPEPDSLAVDGRSRGPRRPPRLRRSLPHLLIATLVLAAIPPFGAASPPSGPRPAPSAPSGPGVAVVRPAEPAKAGPTQLCPWTNPPALNITIAISHLYLDVGEWFFINASAIGGLRNATHNATLRWSVSINQAPFNNSTPPWMHVSGLGNGRVNGTVHVVGNITLKASAYALNNTSRYLDCKTVTLIVAAPLTLVEFGASPSTGPPPLAVTLAAATNGGTGTITVSWLTGDLNVAIGRIWNHTYAAAGTYRVQAWINDTTSVWSRIGSLYANLTVTVVAPHVARGPFGLPALAGWGLIGVFVVLLVGGVIYSVATRRRPKPLPRPEEWMIPGTEGRAGAEPAQRPEALPPGPGPSDRLDPSGSRPPGPGSHS